MTWAIVQYDNRPLNDKYTKLMERNKQYCGKHGYDHIFISQEYDIPPYWRKVKVVQDTLPKYEGILWLDTDATVYNIDKPLTSFRKEGKSFYYSPDGPLLSSEMNAGVWLVLNDEIGKDIMDEWFNSYSPDNWIRENTKWTSKGDWAGYTYEQGAFVKLVKPVYTQALEIHPWQTFQSFEPSPEAFTFHFAGELEDKYLPTFLDSLSNEKAPIQEDPDEKNGYYVIVALVLCISLCIISLIYHLFIHSPGMPLPREILGFHLW